MKIYMRTAQCDTVTAAQMSHCELYNPSDSGVIVSLLGLWVARTSGIHVCGKGDPALTGSNFPNEPRGLPTYWDPDDGDAFYARARTGYQVTPSNVYIEGGMVMAIEGIEKGREFRFHYDEVTGRGEMQRRPGKAWLVRNIAAGERLIATFLWREDPLPA